MQYFSDKISIQDIFVRKGVIKLPSNDPRLRLQTPNYGKNGGKQVFGKIT